MNTSEIPATYDQWVHCITVKCRIPLTAEFARARIAILGNATSPESVRFVRLYGESHRERVLEWYQRVLNSSKEN